MSDARRAQNNADVAERIVASLVAGGVREAVASPGSRNTPLVLALRARSDVRLHTVIDERVAGFLALGLARASGRPAALVCTSGSAGGHYLPAIMEACASRVGLVALTADRPPELHGCGAPQTTPQQDLFGEHALARLALGPADDLDGSERLEPRLASLFDRARSGPVQVNVAFREPLWAPGVVYGAPTPSRQRVLRGAPTLPGPTLDALAEELSGARGAIVCGPRADAGDPAFAAAVTALAARLGWPQIAGPTSGARFGAEAVVATGDVLLRSAAFCRDARADVVLRFGQVPTSKPIQRWLAQAEAAVLVDPWGDRHDVSGHAETLAVADPTWLCRALTERVTGCEPTWLERWQRAADAADAALEEACADGFWEGAIARAVALDLPAGALLHVASSMPIRDLDAFAPARTKPLRVLASRGVNGIDGTVATACGEALVHDGPTLALLGDLACLHDAGGLLAARGVLGDDADVTFVVINNGGGGIFSYLPIAAHDEAFASSFLTPRPFDLAALCAAAGLEHVRVEDLDTLRANLGGLRVVEAVVDRETNVARHHAAWEAAELAVAACREEDPCPVA